MKSLIVFASFLATSIAMACPADRLCSGDRVINSSDGVGTVVEVFSNGKATVSFDSYYGIFIKNVRSLKKGQKCFKKFCEGDRIIDSDDNFGKIKEIFENGKAKISLDFYFGLPVIDAYHGLFIRDLNTSGKGFRCIENICVGERVVDGSSRTGRIDELFDNGKAKVLLDSGYLSIQSFRSFGIKLNCRLRENCSCQN